MKRVLPLLLALAVLLALPVSAANVTVALDGAVMDVPAVLRNGVTYVPLRAFCAEAGGCTVSWNSAARTATVSGALTLTIPTGVSAAQCLGATVALTGASYIENGTLFVPVRALAAARGSDAAWDAGSRTAYIGDTDLYWLSRIIEAEAGAEPYAGKLAVGSVILNRRASAEFPNTVYGVIFDRSYGGQFTPVRSGTIYCAPSGDSLAAARACLAGTRAAGGSLYFFNPRTSTAQGWIVANRTFCARIGNHDFYL